MLIEPRNVAWARRGPKWRRVPVSPGPVLRPRNGNTARICDHIHTVRRLKGLSASTSHALHAQASNEELAGVLQSRLISRLWRFNISLNLSRNLDERNAAN